ncbi:MAG: sulfite exporter TauE/SafE family protein [Oscillospiraceae bacterium]|nr:sulfite exporter TauE/SafE family protein [Oscillospiraceae bacterium]
MSGQFAAIAFFTFMAGLVQGVSGFGSGTLQMMILPWFFPLNEATGISGVVCCFLTGLILWQYRKHINYKKIFLPILIYTAGAYWAISYSTRVDQELMQRVMGGFLILLACYFLFVKKNKVEHVGALLMVIFSLVSGVCDGLFGIGGPLMVMMYLSNSDSKEEYFANSQAHFFITLVLNCIIRVSNGIIKTAHIPYMLAGIVTIWVGGRIAKRIADRIDADRLRHIVYCCVGAAGLINLIGI